MVVHVGTHVDSPRHFFNDGPAFREIPVTRLSGLGRVRGIRPGMAR
jgi:kynurenine formamidase